MVNEIMSEAQKTITQFEIIVPHDGSRASDRAMDKAIEFAKKINADIVLVNVVDDRLIPPSTILTFLSDKTSVQEAKGKLISYLEQGAEAMLKDKLQKAKSEGINVRHILAVGSPADEIVKLAENENAGLIIMGKSQVETMGEKLRALGSVTRRVSETSKVPVMIVH